MRAPALAATACASLAMSTLSPGSSPKSPLHIAVPHDPAAGGDAGSVQSGAVDGAGAGWGGEGGGQAAACSYDCRRRHRCSRYGGAQAAGGVVERRMAAFVKAMALPGVASLCAVRAHRARQVQLVEALPAQEAADLLRPLRSGGPIDAALGLQPNLRIDMHQREGERYIEQHKEELERRAARGEPAQGRGAAAPDRGQRLRRARADAGADREELQQAHPRSAVGRRCAR